MLYNVSAQTNRIPGRFAFQLLPIHKTILWAKRPPCADSRPAVRLSNGSVHGGRFAMYNETRFGFTPELKTRILERDGYVCLYCGADATEVDHITPYSYNHCNDESNLASACRDCNAIAHDKIFKSLADKCKYIKRVRETRRWTGKLNRREQAETCICIDCHRAFKPRVNGSTIFQCKDCARMENMNLEQKKKYIHKKGLERVYPRLCID